MELLDELEGETLAQRWYVVCVRGDAPAVWPVGRGIMVRRMCRHHCEAGVEPCIVVGAHWLRGVCDGGRIVAARPNGHGVGQERDGRRRHVFGLENLHAGTTEQDLATLPMCIDVCVVRAMAPQRPGLWSPPRSQLSGRGTRAMCDEQRNDAQGELAPLLAEEDGIVSSPVCGYGIEGGMGR